MIYTYGENDYVFETSWAKPKTTQFDIALQSKWQTALENGYFRYRLNILDFKRLPGEYSFLAQLNPERASNRRPPESIHSLAQPFDAEKFNFTKIQENEILFQVNEKTMKSCSDSLVINVSPLEYGHSLLIPDRFACLPQVLTLESLKRAVELILLSGSSSLRAGFNSLCGYATVNHLHLHLYYLQHQMLLEHIEVEKFSGPCHVLKKYPANGFVFQMNENHDIFQLVSSVFKLTNYFQIENIAHNLYITRGCSFDNQLNDKSVLDTVRIYVWARKHSPEKQSDCGFDPAICELFGHLVVKAEDTYTAMTESKVAEELSSICEELFQQVSDSVKSIYEEVGNH